VSESKGHAIVLTIGEDLGVQEAAWTQPEFLERGWQHWAVEESRPTLPGRSEGETTATRLRVRSTRSGNGVERALLQALRDEPDWVAVWFPAGGPPPSLVELERMADASEQSDLVLVRTATGLCRLLALRETVPLLFRDLSWLQAPRANDLMERALDVEASVYSWESD